MRCRAHRRDGSPCGAWAVQDSTTCRMHGGTSPQARKAAARRREERQAQKTAELFAVPVETSPSQALLDLVQWTAGEVAYWRSEVRKVAEEEPAKLTAGLTKIVETGDVKQRTVETTPHIAYRMLTSASDRLERYSTAALRAGVEERRVRLAEDQGALVAQVIRRVLDRLDLSEWQAEMVGSVVPEELRALSRAV